MTFSLPTYNLPVSIYTGTTIPPVGPPRVSTVGNLAWGLRTMPQRLTTNAATVSTSFSSATMLLLLPALTDIRPNGITAVADTVEVPSGSGRYYFVLFVDDIGKGFPNEHRGAMLQQHGTWPVPIP
jgi:hypothetical protein